MVSQKNTVRYFSLILPLAFLVSCSLSKPDKNGNSKNIVFPEQKDASFKGGSYVSVAGLKKMGPGMNKKQIRQLLGSPQFSEGMIGVREWDYVFRFRRPESTDLICQYKILFDNDMIAQNFYFKPQNCLRQIPETGSTPPPPVIIDRTFKK